MFNKLALLILVFAGVFFAGPYTDYCLDQSDPCFQSNCYKVSGNWASNPDTGKMDCIYDTSAYSDSQIQSAFGTCIQESDKCEQMMESGKSYSSSGPSGNSDTSSPSCCGSPLVLVTMALLAVFVRSKD
jgi:hypothetical protein